MKHSLKITLFLVGLFFIAQVIGLAVTNQYIDYETTSQTGTLTWEPLPTVATVEVEPPQLEAKELFFYFISAILIGTLMILLIIKLKKIILWKFWYFLAVLVCLTMAFGAFIASNVAFVLSLIAGYLKVFKSNIFVHNITELFVYAGLAAIFVRIKGFTLPVIIIILILVSIYDMYAVWKSKHMIKMAQFQTKANVFAGMMIPYKLPKKQISKKEKDNKKIAKRMIKKKIQTAVLGGGDIAFPLLFAGIVMKSYGIFNALIIPVFAAIALFFLLYKAQKEKFYPAMPFLTIGCFVGYAVILLINYY